jgi:hypothetical protein
VISHCAQGNCAYGIGYQCGVDLTANAAMNVHDNPIVRPEAARDEPLSFDLVELRSIDGVSGPLNGI